MLRKLSRLIFVLLILAVSLYVVLLNRESVVINLGGDHTFNSPLGALVIVIFAAGVLCAALVASFFGFKAYLRERGFLSEERRKAEFDKDSSTARGLTLTAQISEAKRMWESLVKRRPHDAQAKIWLAKTLIADGQVREALKIIDKARASHPGDIETLFTASELNYQLGNITSAIDNLALIMAHQPNVKAALTARDLSMQLGRFEDALEYNKQLENFDLDGDLLREFEAKVRLKKIQSSYPKPAALEPESKNAYLADLLKLGKEFPDCSAAQLACAEIEINSGNIDKASQAFIKAAYIEKSPQAWERAAHLWIGQGQPDRALAVAKLALKESEEKDRPEFELLLGKVYISLAMYSEAADVLRKVQKKDLEQSKVLEAIKLLGQSLLKEGKEAESAALWNDLKLD